jgi:hypothetical protein
LFTVLTGSSVTLNESISYHVVCICPINDFPCPSILLVLFDGYSYYKVFVQYMDLFLFSSLTVFLITYSDMCVHTTLSMAERAWGRACLADIDGQYNIHVIGG